MKQLQIDARIRDKTGKRVNKRLRNQGFVPVIIYNKGKKSIPLAVSGADLIHALHTSAGENVIINLNIEKDKKKQNKTVIIKDIQYHPIRGDILHVDFDHISLTEKVTVKVPISIKGEPIGVKRDNGVLEHILWELEIECLATEIPEKIEVDVSLLEIGDMIHVKDLTVEEGVKILNNADSAVVGVELPKKTEEEKPEEEAVEEQEKEPEVIGEKEREERANEKEQEKHQKQTEQ